MLPAISSFAADTAVSAESQSSINPMFIGLGSVIVILLLAIAVLGNVLRQLAFVYRDKMRTERGSKSVVPTVLLILALTVPSISTWAQEAAGGAEAAVASTASAFINGIPRSDFYALMFIVSLELLIIFSMMLYMRLLLKTISAKQEVEAGVPAVKKVSFWDRFNAVVPIEKEQDILLDHDYDGIHELDNSLPPWWIYGFYLTILVSFVYIWYYHAGGNGPSSEQEYIASVKEGEEAKAAYLAKTAGNIDETNVKLADAAGMAEGKLLFSKNCAACHAADGGGSVGPNLTDEYWIHGGSLPDVFKSIKYGWQDKGMKPWKEDFSPRQLASLSSYVTSLVGTKPAAPKEKQGELYVAGAATADTTAGAVADTAAKGGKVIAIQ